MNRIFGAAVLAAACIFPSNAGAWYFGGNPTVSIWVDRSLNDLEGADTTVDAVWMHKCAGGYNVYSVDQQADLTNALTVNIDEGDYCGVSVHFGATMRIEQLLDGFIVDFEEPSASIEILDSTGTGDAALLPLEVISGPVNGGSPRIYVDIN